VRRKALTQSIPAVPDTGDARRALERQVVGVRFARYEQAMEAAERALEAHRYDRALAEYNVALQVQPDDAVAKAAVERTRRLTQSTRADDRPHVTAKVKPAVAPAPRETEGVNKVTDALRSLSPAAGHVADTLRTWSERGRSK
jgi:hypothetical protein